MTLLRIIFCVVGLSLSLVSCRRDYRSAADHEVGELLADMPGFGIETNGTSRLKPPSPHEFPLVPPDDPAARVVSEVVLGKDVHPDGNRSTPLENPEWRSWLPLNKQGRLNLSLPGAVRLALRHSPEFQREKEDLYLAALDVTYERRRLSPRPFASAGASLERSGSSSDLDGVTTGSFGFWGVAGGASWVASLASKLTLDLSEGSTEFGGSLANLTLTQPLLRGAGRRVIRENLTRSERNLLVNARRMEQFRQGFFLDVVTGGNPASGPNRGGGGFSNPGLVAGTPSGRTGASGVSGFFGLLQSLQGIRNQEANVAKLKDSLAQLEAAFDAGRIGNRLQVDQARQALYNAQSSLLASKAIFETRLDGFKISLGLPPDLPVVIDASYVDRFRLTDPALAGLQDDLVELLERIRSPEASPSSESLLECSMEAIALFPVAARSLVGFARDRVELSERLPVRMDWFKRLRERKDLKEAGMGADAFKDKDLADIARLLEESSDRLVPEFAVAKVRMVALGNQLAGLPLAEGRSLLAAETMGFSSLMLELSLARASARLESIVMKEVRVEAEEALEVARERRLDWMNTRARLVDVWRDTALARDDLRSDLDLVLSGDLGSTGRGAGHFRRDEGRLNLGLEFDSALDKVAERNRYREALINYQRARREYISYEDGTYRSLRNTARIARLSQLNFELSRAAVRGAIAQVDLARLRLQQPPQPGRNAQFGATTARDLVNALNDLLEASNGFLQVWVGYEALRMRLDYELGTMRLDEEGLWMDPGPILAKNFLPPKKVVPGRSP